MILLTVVPSAVKTSIGSRIRSLLICANPMEIVVAASPARNSLDSTSGHPATCRVRQSHLPTDCALPVDLCPDTFFRDTTLPGDAVSRTFGPLSDILPTLLDATATRTSKKWAHCSQTVSGQGLLEHNLASTRYRSEYSSDRKSCQRRTLSPLDAQAAVRRDVPRSNALYATLFDI